MNFFSVAVHLNFYGALKPKTPSASSYKITGNNHYNKNNALYIIKITLIKMFMWILHHATL